MYFRRPDQQAPARDGVLAFLRARAVPLASVCMQQMKYLGKSRWQVTPVV